MEFEVYSLFELQCHIEFHKETNATVLPVLGV